MPHSKNGVELVPDELRQAKAGGLFGLDEEALGALQYQAVQRGLHGSVALVAYRGTITMRPPGLAGVGLHALGTGNLGWCSFSGRAGQRIRHWRTIQAPVALTVKTSRRAAATRP